MFLLLFATIILERYINIFKGQILALDVNYTFALITNMTKLSFLGVATNGDKPYITPAVSLPACAIPHVEEGVPSVLGAGAPLVLGA